MSKARKPTPTVTLGHTVLSREEDVLILHRELIAMADSFGVDDYRLLDKHKVLTVVEADPAHPMRALGYEWDDAVAARAHRLVHTGRLITGLRVVTPNGPGKKVDAAPVYYFAANLMTSAGEVRRGHVHRDQLSKHDPSFVSVVHKQVEQIKLATARLGHVLRCNAAGRKTWDAPWLLADGIASALDGFDASANDRAAE